MATHGAFPDLQLFLTRCSGQSVRAGLLRLGYTRKELEKIDPGEAFDKLTDEEGLTLFGPSEHDILTQIKGD